MKRYAKLETYGKPKKKRFFHRVKKNVRKFRKKAGEMHDKFEGYLEKRDVRITKSAERRTKKYAALAKEQRAQSKFRKARGASQDFGFQVNTEAIMGSGFGGKPRKKKKTMTLIWDSKKAIAFVWLGVLVVLVIFAIFYILLDQPMDQIVSMTSENVTGTDYEPTFNKEKAIWDAIPFIFLLMSMVFLVSSAIRRRNQ